MWWYKKKKNQKGRNVVTVYSPPTVEECRIKQELEQIERDVQIANSRAENYRDVCRLLWTCSKIDGFVKVKITGDYTRDILKNSGYELMALERIQEGMTFKSVDSYVVWDMKKFMDYVQRGRPDMIWTATPL